jgi:hypothetical protein
MAQVISYSAPDGTLKSHVFLKEKRDGSRKGRTVAGGNKQRGYIRKEDASSPTILVESVLLTCVVDAEEGRDVAVIDIANAFIQTRVEEEKDVHKAHVTKDKKGVSQPLVQCQNAIYGTMVASLLCYRKFAKSLTSIGFVINPYDPCVANKMVRGKQITICWHVDDLKVSHVMPKVMDRMIKYLRKEQSMFEDGSGAMEVSRGKTHMYLGMTLDYNVRGQVSVTMFDHLDDILTVSRR